MKEIDFDALKQIEADYIKQAPTQIRNALQVHAWKCNECGKPFLTTYRAYETVRNCPYCDSTMINHELQMRGARAIVIW